MPTALPATVSNRDTSTVEGSSARKLCSLGERYSSDCQSQGDHDEGDGREHGAEKGGKGQRAREEVLLVHIFIYCCLFPLLRPLRGNQTETCPLFRALLSSAGWKNKRQIDGTEAVAEQCFKRRLCPFLPVFLPRFLPNPSCD